MGEFTPFQARSGRFPDRASPKYHNFRVTCQWQDAPQQVSINKMLRVGKKWGGVCFLERNTSCHFIAKPKGPPTHISLLGACFDTHTQTMRLKRGCRKLGARKVAFFRAIELDLSIEHELLPSGKIVCRGGEVLLPAKFACFWSQRFVLGPHDARCCTRAWVQTWYPKWNPGKWKLGLKSAVLWRLNLYP